MKPLLPVLLLLSCGLGLIACDSEKKQEANAAPSNPDYFERKVKCQEIASRLEKEVFAGSPGSGYTRIIYSPKRHSCIAAASILSKNGVVTLTIDDLLSSESLWIDSCGGGQKVDCKTLNNKQESEMNRFLEP